MTKHQPTTQRYSCLEGSGRKKLPPPMGRIPGVGGWVTKKLMVMQAEVLNQSLVDKLLDDDENQRPRTPYICTSFSSVSSSNPCLADHPYLAKNLCLADNPYPADNPCFTQLVPTQLSPTQLNPTHLSYPLPLAKAELSHDSEIFEFGRPTGFKMGISCGIAETTICSWKLDEKGVFGKTITCEHTIQPVHDIHSHSYLYFRRAGDSGATVFDLFGGFIGLYFAGKGYTGSGYFVAAGDLFSDIKRMTSAEEVELLPIS